jgi:hypothetical protein
VGLTQFLLATGFVIWLVFLPGTSANFAWPIENRLSSMFIGACFALRAFEGWLMWRERAWSRLRWMSWGTMAFLIVIFIATYWHLDQMNWVPFNIATVVWMLAYTIEPLAVPFVEPRGDNASAAGEQDQAAVSPSLQAILMFVMTVAAALLGALLINPAKFITNYWPWPLSAFDARIASAFFAGILFWAARMLLIRKWDDIRLGMQGFILFFGAHFLIWGFNLVSGQFDPSRSVAVWLYGLVAGLITAILVIVYAAHERSSLAAAAALRAAAR